MTLAYSVKPGVAGPGSAYIEYGSASGMVRMIAVVKGPKQHASNKPAFEIEVSFAGFFSKDKLGTEIGGDIATFLREGFEQSIDMDSYAHSSVTVHIKVLDGPLSNMDAYLAPGIIVLGEALNNSGIKLKDTVVCGTVSVSPRGELSIGHPVPDSIAKITVGFQKISGKVTLLHQTGVLQDGADVIDRVVQLAMASLAKIW